jgi:hypothetical protein
MYILAMMAALAMLLLCSTNSHGHLGRWPLDAMRAEFNDHMNTYSQLRDGDNMSLEFRGLMS